jgi:hypothetical protein
MNWWDLSLSVTNSPWIFTLAASQLISVSSQSAQASTIHILFLHLGKKWLRLNLLPFETFFSVWFMTYVQFNQSLLGLVALHCIALSTNIFLVSHLYFILIILTLLCSMFLIQWECFFSIINNCCKSASAASAVFFFGQFMYVKCKLYFNSPFRRR